MEEKMSLKREAEKWKKRESLWRHFSLLHYFRHSFLVLELFCIEKKNKERTRTGPGNEQEQNTWNPSFPSTTFFPLSFFFPSFIPFSLSLYFEEEERRKRWKGTEEEGNFISFILDPFFVLHTFVSTSIDWQQNEAKEGKRRKERKIRKGKKSKEKKEHRKEEKEEEKTEVERKV